MSDFISSSLSLNQGGRNNPRHRQTKPKALRRLGKVSLFIVSLFLFILAITLLKEGANDLAPLVRDRFQVTNSVNSLGFGWLFAYVVMSGSPVAAVALTFFDAGVLDPLETFMMIAGSRLGASFIVLFMGFIYVLRGRNRATSLSMGLLSLIITGTIHLAGLLIGLPMVKHGWFSSVQLPSGFILTSAMEFIFNPIAQWFLAFLPRWPLFLIGFGLIIITFTLFDKCLPQMSLRESHFGQMSRLVYQPWVMFLLGAIITLLSMSVSVSLGILVPLSQRGFVRRENVIPYIMGANITTFADTLLAAVLLNNPTAFSIVLAEMVSITLFSLLILGVFYRFYQQNMLDLVAKITQNNRNLAIFMLIILIVPVILLRI